MATKVHMEALSPTMEEGRLVKWTKHEGDAVKSGDTLAEVETDKAVMELVARADGQLLKVLVPEGTTVPVGNIVAWIAKRLAASLGPIPHFFLTTEIDMERAAEAREALNKQLGEAGGKISFNDIVIKAVALALVQHRACNAWFQEDHIRYWNEVHVGMAVAIEDGLITPVIRNADMKSLRQIGEESRELAGRARTRRLKPEDYTRATVIVSDLRK